MRNTLVAALVACTDQPLKPKARRFLRGLSADELQFIAGYLGARILASEETCGDGLTHIHQPRTARVTADRELKMILLREYLCRAGVQELPLSMGVN